MAISAEFANMTFAELEQLLTAQQAVDYLLTLGIEISPDRLRGLARKGQVPGAGIVMKKPAFVKVALKDWSPPVSAGVAPRREDGRRPHKIYLKDEERALLGKTYEFAAKKKRKPKAKAKAEGETKPEHGPPTAEAAETDPFDAFPDAQEAFGE